MRGGRLRGVRKGVGYGPRGSSIFPRWSGDVGVLAGCGVTGWAQMPSPRGAAVTDCAAVAGTRSLVPCSSLPRGWGSPCICPRTPHSTLPTAGPTHRLPPKAPGEPSASDKDGAGEAASDSGKPGRERAAQRKSLTWVLRAAEIVVRPAQDNGGPGQGGGGGGGVMVG